MTGLLKKDGKVVGGTLHDQVGGARYEVRARAVVSATGVFEDDIRKLDRPGAPNLVNMSKGTHLVFREADVPLGVSTVFFSPIDGRPLFLVKREGCFLLGTTDEWEDTEPGVPTPRQHDVEYLLASLRQFARQAQHVTPRHSTSQPVSPKPLYRLAPTSLVVGAWLFL